MSAAADPSADFTLDPAILARPARLVEARINAFLSRRPLPANLADAIRYAVLGPGKRLRPVLTIHACEAVGGAAEDALPAAAAIEMIHCFSLVHDDLPAMDDDDLRRGRPTLHKATSEAMAILAGDAMMGLAFELVAESPKSKVQSPKSGEKPGRILAELAVATNDMIAGQVYDTLPDFPAGTEPLAKLKTIHRNKTGALIRCACRMGAIAGEADAAELAAITAYAEAVGLMFQVIDDLLDVTQTTEQLGKAARKDADKGKLTYPGLLGVEGSRGEVRRLHDEALAALEPLGSPAQPLRDLCRYMAVRTR